MNDPIIKNPPVHKFKIQDYKSVGRPISDILFKINKERPKRRRRATKRKEKKSKNAFCSFPCI